MPEHRAQHAVVAHIGAKTKLFVGLHRVGAGILQLIGLDLIEQANAATLLPEVEQGAPALCGDRLQRRLQLVAAVATQAEQGVASEAFRVHPHQHRLAVAHIPHGQHQVLLVGFRVFETVHIEIAPLGGEAGRFYVAYCHSGNPAKKAGHSSSFIPPVAR